MHIICELPKLLAMEQKQQHSKSIDIFSYTTRNDPSMKFLTAGCPASYVQKLINKYIIIMH